MPFMKKNILYFSLIFFVSSLVVSGGLFSSKMSSMLSYKDNYYDINQAWFTGDEEDSYNSPGQEFIDVLHYSIKLDLYPEQKRIKGDVTLQFIFADSLHHQFIINFYDNMKIHKVLWNGRATNYSNYKTTITIEPKIILDTKELSSGIYYYTIKVTGFAQSKKMLLMK